MTARTLVITVLLLILVAFCLLMGYALKENGETIKQLQNEKIILKHNINYVLQYSGIISQIKQKKEDVINEIIKAESADEITDILLDLVESNNSRL